MGFKPFLLKHERQTKNTGGRDDREAGCLTKEWTYYLTCIYSNIKPLMNVKTNKLNDQ